MDCSSSKAFNLRAAFVFKADDLKARREEDDGVFLEAVKNWGEACKLGVDDGFLGVLKFEMSLKIEDDDDGGFGNGEGG